MHRNVFNVLKPGGAAFHLIPTLFASPFVINRIFPERLSSKLLELLTPRREISPKFPAYYSACHGDTRKMRKMFKDIGYSRVEIRNFYGHFYYEKIPVRASWSSLSPAWQPRTNGRGGVHTPTSRPTSDPDRP
ncbi:hypothetical protein [Sphingomonas daechungensis]|uniref:hypothetical protein n=1 Tax=Sphingomonas daechungensis TaxID=1176646 RepID=UPI0021D523AA|nr:hypothetical protein [Sphingomonas daechungensis]